MNVALPRCCHGGRFQEVWSDAVADAGADAVAGADAGAAGF